MLSLSPCLLVFLFFFHLQTCSKIQLLSCQILPDFCNTNILLKALIQSDPLHTSNDMSDLFLANFSISVSLHVLLFRTKDQASLEMCLSVLLSGHVLALNTTLESMILTPDYDRLGLLLVLVSNRSSSSHSLALLLSFLPPLSSYSAS